MDLVKSSQGTCQGPYPREREWFFYKLITLKYYLIKIEKFNKNWKVKRYSIENAPNGIRIKTYSGGMGGNEGG